ncbi:MAG: DUF3990 domain-containing protein [Oscillospiraceae bacterium]|nr:DUF3990 domain-containing protein [Oscillospiraceae bacterium]
MLYTELTKPLYHGTCETFSSIDLSKSAAKKDFGRGFYTTNDIEQARKFARLKAVRADRLLGYVYTFGFTDNNDLKIRAFQSANEEWFDYVLWNRGFGQYASSSENNPADIVIGPVADDAVGVVLNNFIDGVYGDLASPEAKATAVRLLLTQKLHNQVFFGTEAAINCLTITGVSNVYID